MGEQKSWDKGDRVAITGGRAGQGVRGEIFWSGDSRYGEGKRFGIRGDDGDTYWVDEEHVGDESEAPPTPTAEAKPPLEKGTRVTLVRGAAAGVTGEVFWVGENRYGPGLRYGVRGDDDETHWVDERLVEAIDEPAPAQAASPGAAHEPSAGPEGAGAPPPLDDVPFPSDDQGYGAFDDADDEPPF